MKGKRTPTEWLEICDKITAGYTPGGDKRTTYMSGVRFVMQLQTMGLWKAGDKILDMGSGNGRLAMGLCEFKVEYHGVEIIKPCVDFCKQAFKPYPHCRFFHLDIKNGRYWPQGTIEPDHMTLPFRDNRFDLIVANSLFSHLYPESAVNRYLSELTRVLAPGGSMFTTWRKSPPHELCTNEKTTTWLEETIRGFLGKTGLVWVYDDERNVTGNAAEKQEQWVIVLEKDR